MHRGLRIWLDAAEAHSERAADWRGSKPRHRVSTTSINVAEETGGGRGAVEVDACEAYAFRASSSSFTAAAAAAAAATTSASSSPASSSGHGGCCA